MLFDNRGRESKVRALGGPWTYFCPVQGAKLCSNSCDGFLVKTGRQVWMSVK